MEEMKREFAGKLYRKACEIAVENLIENGILDEDVFNEYLKEA